MKIFLNKALAVGITILSLAVTAAGIMLLGLVCKIVWKLFVAGFNLI
jgi:hypothetical protein